MVKKSRTFETPGAAPPAIIPLILFEAPARSCLATVKLPKSVEFPVEAIVTYSFTFVSASDI